MANERPGQPSPNFKKPGKGTTQEQDLTRTLADVAKSITISNERSKNQVSASDLAKMIRSERDVVQKGGKPGPLLTKANQLAANKASASFLPVDYMDFMLGNKSEEQIATERTQKGVETGIALANRNLEALGKALNVDAPLISLQKDLSEQRKIFKDLSTNVSGLTEIQTKNVQTTARVADNIGTLIPIEEEELQVLKDQAAIAQETLDEQKKFSKAMTSYFTSSMEEAGLQRVLDNGPTGGPIAVSDRVSEPTTFLGKMFNFLGNTASKTKDFLSNANDSLRKFSESLDHTTSNINKHGLDTRDLPGILGTIASLAYILKNIQEPLAKLGAMFTTSEGFGNLLKGLGKFFAVIAIAQSIAMAAVAYPVLPADIGKNLLEAAGKIGHFLFSISELFAKLWIIISPLMLAFGTGILVIADGLAKDINIMAGWLDSLATVIDNVNHWLDDAIGGVAKYFKGLKGDTIGEKALNMFKDFDAAYVAWGNGVINAAGAWIQSILDQFLRGLTGVGQDISNVVSDITTQFWNGLILTVTDVTNFFSGLFNFEGWKQNFANTNATMSAGLQAALTSVQTAISGVWTDLETQAGNVVSQFGAGLQGVWTDFSTTTGNIATQFGTGLQLIGQDVTTTTGGIINQFSTGVTNIWNDLSTWFQNTFTDISTFLSIKKDETIAWFQSLPQKVIQSFKEDPFVQAVEKLWQTIVNLIPTPEKIMGWVDNMIAGNSFIPQFTKDWIHGQYMSMMKSDAVDQTKPDYNELQNMIPIPLSSSKAQGTVDATMKGLTGQIAPPIIITNQINNNGSIVPQSGGIGMKGPSMITPNPSFPSGSMYDAPLFGTSRLMP